MNLFCFMLKILGKDTYYFSNRNNLIAIIYNYLHKIDIKQAFLVFLKLYFLNDKVKWLGNEFNENISINHQSKKG